MQQRIWLDLANDSLHGVTIADVGAHEIHRAHALQPGEIFGGALARQVVEHSHGPTALIKAPRRMHADESRATSNEDRGQIDSFVSSGKARLKPPQKPASARSRE